MSKNKPNESTPLHAINWFEIPTRDLDRAVGFYEKTFGHRLKREVFAGMPHAVFPSANSPTAAGAIVEGGPHLSPGAQGTVVYLDCSDGVAATLGRAKAHGAQVVVPHTAVGPFGFIAVIDDLDGNRVGLHATQP